MSAEAVKARDGGSPLASVDPGWAWARYEPGANWNRDLAAHLFRRVAFGGTRAELQKAVTQGPHATIDQLFETPASYADFDKQSDGYEAAAAHSGDGLTLDAWWLRRMRESPWPLLERMTLFWHGYFPVRASAAGDLKQWHAHVRLLRSKALSDIPSLLQALAADVAMYSELGGEQNRKARPNVRFAKAWLEGFTVGPKAGNADDVLNLARAWTGWFVYSGKLRFVDREYDAETKTILNSQGNFGRDDAVRLLASHPATALNVSAALFRCFVSESASPPDQLLLPIAKRLGAGASLREVLDTVLRSNLFFSEHALRQKIKSPVELVLGLIRSLEGALPAGALAAELVNLGQRLDEPPTIRGWAGGTDWLNGVTVAARLRVCDSLLRGAENLGKGLDPAVALDGSAGGTRSEQAEGLLDLLLGGALAKPAQARIAAEAAGSPESLRALARLAIAQPEFQLS